MTTVPEGFLKLPSGNRPFVLVTNDGKVSMRRHDQTIGDIANQLSQAVGRPVIDQTSLKGTYNFELYYQMLGVHAADPADGSFAPAGGPTPFQAAEQQLGLHLQPGKGPVPIFVVDYSNRKPTEN